MVWEQVLSVGTDWKLAHGLRVPTLWRKSFFASLPQRHFYSVAREALR